MTPGRRFNKKDEKSSEFEERVVEISRVSRVVKGGRRIRFRVLVVIGNRKGRIGYGIAKGNEIAVAVQKAVSLAKKRLIDIPIINDTIPYQVTQASGSSTIFLKPASQGTSVVAGGVVRVVAELAGIKNLLSKTIGSANKVNNTKAMFAALVSFDPEKVEKVKSRFDNKNKEAKISITPSTEINNDKEKKKVVKKPAKKVTKKSIE